MDAIDSAMRLNMDIALETACRCLPPGFDAHENRRIIASSILDCISHGSSQLDDLIQAANCAAARLVNEKTP